MGWWCADYRGEFLLGNHRYCNALTITDFARRTCSSVKRYLDAIFADRVRTNRCRINAARPARRPAPRPLPVVRDRWLHSLVDEERLRPRRQHLKRAQELEQCVLIVLGRALEGEARLKRFAGMRQDGILQGREQAVMEVRGAAADIP